MANDASTATPPTLSLQGVPDHVARELMRAVKLLGTIDADPETDLESAGDLISAAQAVSGWAESMEIEGTRRLVHAIEQDPVIDLGEREPRSSARTRRAEARRAAALEVQVLTGRSLSQCRDRVALAAATPARGGYLRERLASGTTCAYRVITVVKETRHLDPLTADRIARAALRPLGKAATDPIDPESLHGEIAAAAEAGFPLSQGTFRRRLRAELTRVESTRGLGDRLATEAVAGREMRTELGNFGMAITWISAERDRAFAATSRIDRLARAARSGGDERTLDQLRSDIATDLLIHGQVPGDALLGSAPSARLNVYVPIEAILPLADGAGSGESLGEVPGLGFLTPEQVRRVALASGSTWRRLVTDAVTGAVVDAERTYRPSQAMRELLVARDGTCRAPGCELPARESDLDHTISWVPGTVEPRDGATHRDNLKALHRGHHHAKTRRWWTCLQDPGGAVHWRTLTGRRLTDHPPDHRSDLGAARRPAPSGTDQLIATWRDEARDPLPISREMAALHRALTNPDPATLDRRQRSEIRPGADLPPF
ncbi:HNH endonuclease signature motif containing protein [Demetria terragena]|uniref:HNH endonuclease signature motif containing protein n=1 Tax=Demetria terragena TaxID=63959 RepID=UPI000373B036|nr:HNH endonuclease signature motif containing protein [Demetria terragena]